MNPPLRLLIIEDSEDDALLIVRELTRAGYQPQFHRVDTEASVRAALESTWDVVLSDFSMPKFNGTDALKVLRERDQDTPFIFVSGTIGEHIAVEAMRSGAQDYVIKNNLTRLVPAIERELREAAVRRERHTSDARFRRVVESAMVGILFWDPQGRIMDANDEFLRMVGYTREDLQAGRVDWRAMTPPEYGAADTKALGEVAATGTCTPYEKEFIRKDGPRVPVLIGGAQLPDPAHPGVAFVVDITEQKRAEDALRASEERYRILFQRHPHPLWLFDTETLRFLEVNEAAVRRYGYSRQEFLRMTIEQIRPPDDVPVLYEHLGGAPVGLHASGMWRHRKKDGSIIEVETTEHDVDFLGHPARLVSSVDVTERLKAERALRERERQQAAVATLGEAAVESGDLGKLFAATVVLVGKTLGVPYCKVLELRPHDGVLLLRAGVGWREGCVGHVTVGTEASSQAGYTLEQNEPILTEDLGAETRFRGTDLLHSHGVISGVTVKIPTKTRPFGVLGAHSDRARTFNQDDVHFLQAVAHILGAAIDRERAEAAARQSQRLESVGSLAGGVAHDFNNLLTVILGEAEMAAGTVAAESATRQSLEEIRKAGDRAAALTRQLLAFSRKQIVEPKVFDVNELVASTDKMLRRLIGEDIELTTRTGRQRALVRMDPGQLEQVLVNLVVNARDAMPGGGKLTIETDRATLDEDYAYGHADARPGDYILLAISDSGTGMSEEVKAHAFEPFFTTKEAGKGTGLGLATCYGIAKQAGGHIAIYSEAGVGTTMKVYLPGVSAGTPAVQAEVGRALQGGQEIILMVEDEEAVRRIGSRLLGSQGYRVLEVGSGEEALELLAEPDRHVDLLFTDVVLKGMNGRVLAGRARVLRPGLKVVYASGYTADVALRHGLVDERVVLINKPYTKETLLGKVREVLDEK